MEQIVKEIKKCMIISSVTLALAALLFLALGFNTVAATICGYTLGRLVIYHELSKFIDDIISFLNQSDTLLDKAMNALKELENELLSLKKTKSV